MLQYCPKYIWKKRRIPPDVSLPSGKLQYPLVRAIFSRPDFFVVRVRIINDL